MAEDRRAHGWSRGERDITDGGGETPGDEYDDGNIGGDGGLE